MRKLIAIALLGVSVAACTPQIPSSAQSDPVSSDDYDRADWGNWKQQGGGCDTRELLLKQAGQNVVTDRTCKVVSGSWYSQYDGVTLSVSSKVQIDHIVPVKEAWRSGGASWPDDKKNQFYNDLDNLIAVSSTSNQSKSDDDPAEWLPPRKEFDCTYIKRYDSVKKKWGLAEDPREHQAIANVLAHC